ncbi:MAG: quinoprotein dehydrogenase-associated putative ABC transporter substrate-binding protein [Methyloceanibacter sp.]
MLMLLCPGDDTDEAALSGGSTLGRLACSLNRTILTALAAASLLVASASAQPESGGNIWLHVCADPNNLPFSNEKGEGFENKLAELIASKLNMQVVYTFLPQVMGQIAKLPGNGQCDILMGYAQGTGLVEDTNPYYRTSYVLIYRRDDQSLAGVEALSDDRLKSKKIGIIARTPPASIMAMNGLMANAKSFEVNADRISASPATDVIGAIASGEIDAGILWGPLGGYYAQRSKVPLALVPLVKEKAGPTAIYGITMGVRPNEPEWKHKLNKLIAENQGDINTMLSEYDVPLLDEEGNLIKASTAER